MKKRATPNNEVARPKTQTKYNFNSAKSQRARLLNYLRNYQSVSTIEAREKLDVMHPAARIMELINQGHVIHMIRNVEPTAFGGKHRFGRYYLIKEANHAL